MEAARKPWVQNETKEERDEARGWFEAVICVCVAALNDLYGYDVKRLYGVRENGPLVVSFAVEDKSLEMYSGIHVLKLDK